MVLEFKTKLDRNGNKKYLGIDFNAKSYTRNKRSMVLGDEVVEIKTTDYRKLVEQLEENGFIEIIKL